LRKRADLGKLRPKDEVVGAVLCLLCAAAVSAVATVFTNRPLQKMRVQRWQLILRGCVAIVVGLLSLASTAVDAQWTAATALPEGYADHSLSYCNGFLYNVGGTTRIGGDGDSSHVLFARVGSNGTSGPWSTATSLPEGVFQHTAVAANGFLYVMGGDHFNDTIADHYTNTVYYSKLDTNGTVGSWQITSPLPYAAIFASAAVWDKFIYFIGGLYDATNGFKTNAVVSAMIETNGSLSAWVAQPPLPVPGGVYAHSSVANGFLYVLGGVFPGGIASKHVFFSKINGNGTLAGWNETTQMPQALYTHATVIARGRVYLTGGSTGSSLVNTCYSAAVRGDGTLSAWSNESSLPQPLSEHAVAASDSYIFLSGGINSGSVPQPGVYSLPLPSPPAVPTLTLQGSVSNRSYQLRLTSSTNTGFGIRASTNLTSWTNVGWGFTDTNGTWVFQDTNAALFPRRFYRAYWPLP
jgi:hypothetical protein